MTDAIDSLDGAKVIGWSSEKSSVIVQHDPQRQGAAALREVLARAGFPVREQLPR